MEVLFDGEVGVRRTQFWRGQVAITELHASPVFYFPGTMRIRAESRIMFDGVIDIRGVTEEYTSFDGVLDIAGRQGFLFDGGVGIRSELNFFAEGAVGIG
ncbi:MAG: hypothetical protein A2Y38_07520 [Spirochaetes bacterium GWB1_59_5]|nr:MAG: hypothetical protein A2Y38_07520 [Spirochaetes bacterium GWB1_59_5]